MQRFTVNWKDSVATAVAEVLFLSMGIRHATAASQQLASSRDKGLRFDVTL